MRPRVALPPAYGVVRSPSYFPPWLGQLISNFGDTLHYIALVILVFQLTGQGVAVAALVAAEVVPDLLLGPVAGVVIDRFDRKHVLIAADLVRALLVLSLIWTQSVWHVYLVAAGLAAGNTFFNPTVQVGALLGPLIPNTFATDYRDARWLFVPYVIRGIGDVLIAVFVPLPIALLILFVYGLNTSSGMVVFSTTIQGVVPDAVRGRVFTLLDVSWNTMRLLSLAIGGAMADLAGIRPVFWTGGTLLAAAGLLGMLLLGRYDFRVDPTTGERK